MTHYKLAQNRLDLIEAARELCDAYEHGWDLLDAYKNLKRLSDHKSLLSSNEVAIAEGDDLITPEQADELRKEIESR